MERCWHGKFGGEDQCAGEGLYGNPDYRYRPDRPGLDTFIAFMRAARWCTVHKNPGDRPLEPKGGAAPRPDAGAAGECDAR
jgi:hypothetical protein